MSLLSFSALNGLVRDGIIQNVEPEFVNAASIDITLGREVLLENIRHPLHSSGTVSLRERTPLSMTKVSIDSDAWFDLKPGEFILAQSKQIFHLPDNISAEYKLKSSMARIGLNHLNAGWCDAGWNGSVLTLELVNTTRYHSIRLHEGDRIGQVIFFSHMKVPPKASYARRGRYNGDLTVSGVKQ